jgi:MoaA/NifB/PqqE/SkfB family radical SAM enzyme
MYRAALGLIPRIACYKAARQFGVPLLLPFNLTLAVTGRCNSRCKTCNIWRAGHGDGLSLQQWEKILADIGRAPAWITISGGEPFLRKDFVELMKAVCRYTQPAITSIASNGVLTDKIEHDVREIRAFHEGELVVNLSVDGIGKRHDAIRGIKCFTKVVDTFKRLNALDGVTTGIHSVISRLNADEIPRIHAYFAKLGMRSFICEPAQNRWELHNLKQELAPTDAELEKVLGFLLDARGHAAGVPRVTRLLRLRTSASTETCTRAL